MPPPYNACENTQKGNSHTCLRTRYSAMCYKRSFFSAEPTFCSLQSIPSHLSHQKKEHSLLVLPFVHTILNFATKFFEMFTKKQSRHPHQVFQVFQVFRVFRVFQVFRANNPRLTKRAPRATNTTTPRCSSWSVCRISRR